MRKYTLLTILALFLVSSFANAATNLKEAFSEGTLNGELKVYYFARDFDGYTEDREDFAAGSLLYYHTAPLYGISAGLAFASGHDLGSDDDKAAYTVLGPDHQGYARVQEFYIQGDWYNTKIKYGAHEIVTERGSEEFNTPFVNYNPYRMAPFTYKGLSIENKSISNLLIGAHYITEYMGWFDENFMNVAKTRGARYDKDKALFVLGGKYTIPTETVKSTVQAWYSHMPDVYSHTYLKARIAKQFGEYNLHAGTSALYQKALGDELAGDIDSEQYGVNAGVGAFGADLTAFYGRTGDADLFLPFGDDKAVVQQIYTSARAEEDAYSLKLNYDFSKLGAKGLAAYVIYGIYDTPDSGLNASSDASEVDFNVTYAFQSPALKGASIRVRYAMADVDNGDDITDFRVYLRYKFGTKGK